MVNKKNKTDSKSLDTDTYAHQLFLSDYLREPIIRAAIHTLQLPAGSQGLDAGCGIGNPAAWLAEAVGQGGHVTGLDISPQFLSFARKSAKKSGLSKRVTFREGNAYQLPFDNDTFDWAWSVDCVGYPVTGKTSPLTELARVEKLGGRVAILGWTSQQLLPGYPALEARLNATALGAASYLKGKRPDAHFLRALNWFRDAGFEEPIGRTFVGDIQAPLSDEIRAAVVSLFEMLWNEAKSTATSEDWAEYQRLCIPESPDFILNVPGYYAFFTYSLFQGRVARKP